MINTASTNDVYQRGLSGYLNALGGTNNWQAGTSGGFKYGVGDFMLFGGGGTEG